MKRDTKSSPNEAETNLANRRQRSSTNIRRSDDEALDSSTISYLSPRRKSLMATGLLSPTKATTPISAGERALETTHVFSTASKIKIKNEMNSTTRTLTLYKNRLNALVQQNADLQRQCKQQETDAIEIMGALRDHSEKKDREIIELRSEFDQARFDFEKEKKEIHQSYAKKIEELNNVITDKDTMIRVMEQEVTAIKDFKKKRLELMKEIESQKSQMEEMEHKFKESIVRIERKFFEEKLRMQKDSNKRISELAASAHREAVETLDETTKEIYKENLRLNDAIKTHVSTEEEIMRQNSKLGQKNLQLTQEKEMNDLIVREKITLAKNQNQAIRTLESKVMTLEQTLGHCIREFEVEKERIRESTRAEMEKLKRLAAQLKLNLDRKSMELRYVKKLSLHILDQRTQVEKFFMDALDHVRMEIRKEERQNQKLKKNAYTKHKPAPTPQKDAILQQIKLDDTQTIKQIKEQSQMHLLEIANLTWADKERVLRALFARMNGLLGPEHPAFVEAAKKLESEANYEGDTASSAIDIEMKLKEIDTEG